MRATISDLWRHPVKGLGPERVARAALSAGRTFPGDRVWAIAHEAAKIGPDNAGWARCQNFCRGARSPRLMAVTCETAPAGVAITFRHPDQAPLVADPERAADRAALIDWVARLCDPDRVQPAFVTRADVGMTDSPYPSVSILSNASLAALSKVAGRPLDQRRFRGNIWLDGVEPWAEFDWIGQEAVIGAARLAVRAPITRCTATQVDPETGRVDTETLALLEAHWGHRDFGIYAEVIAPGEIAPGSPVRLA